MHKKESPEFIRAYFFELRTATKQNVMYNNI
jgi:hypothetical protein